MHHDCHRHGKAKIVDTRLYCIPFHEQLYLYSRETAERFSLEKTGVLSEAAIHT